MLILPVLVMLGLICAVGILAVLSKLAMPLAVALLSMISLTATTALYKSARALAGLSVVLSKFVVLIVVVGQAIAVVLMNNYFLFLLDNLCHHSIYLIYLYWEQCCSMYNRLRKIYIGYWL